VAVAAALGNMATVESYGAQIYQIVQDGGS
jgi:hypothetical protein